MFAEMVINENVAPNLRSFTVLSLYGAHRADTPYEEDLIKGRMQLLENLRRDVKDERIVRAIDEAQQKLQKMLEGQTAPKASTPAPAPSAASAK
jgi:hypothetical protein